jgi:hypothetical protein
MFVLSAVAYVLANHTWQLWVSGAIAGMGAIIAVVSFDDSKKRGVKS